MDESIRWNIKVSKETDLAVRIFLGARGAKKGDLSKFIEEAVRWRLLHRSVQDIQRRNAATDPGELQRIINKTVREVRARRYGKKSLIPPDAGGAGYQHPDFPAFAALFA